MMIYIYILLIGLILLTNLDASSTTLHQILGLPSNLHSLYATCVIGMVEVNLPVKISIHSAYHFTCISLCKQKLAFSLQPGFYKFFNNLEKDGHFRK